MQRVTTIGVGLSFVIAVGLLASLARKPTQKHEKPAVTAKAEPAPAFVDPSPSAKISDLLVPEIPPSKGGFDLLPDGRKAPPVPD
ncbi:MAG TPA: hypothetical protein VGP93_18135, partial [Polyangiaceae bacterium]|nr:hypothetical protein [Polyangiaceae bacterium]